MSEIRFTDQHEWVRLDGDEATIGITTFAAQQLGDVVYIELPETGRSFKANEEAAVVESVKAASEVYAPLSGTVSQSNTSLTETPADINTDAQGAGWFFKLKINDRAEFDALLSASAYDTLIKGQ